jgi:hypothetical protein
MVEFVGLVRHPTGLKGRDMPSDIQNKTLAACH